MKFSLAIIAAFASAVSAATLPSAFTLVADGGYTVLTDGQYLYVNGNATSNEIAIFHSTPDTGAVSFTSKNAVPTGWQSLYVVEKDVLPVGLTRPHSGAVPEGASINDFGVTDDGYFDHAGKDYFAVDGYGSNPQKTIYWYGSHNSEYKAVNLWVKEFRE
ncbi:hypothetical protein BJX65DRAFT_18645 [Aspergillus insuetus]